MLIYNRRGKSSWYKPKIGSLAFNDVKRRKESIIEFRENIGFQFHFQQKTKERRETMSRQRSYYSNYSFQDFAMLMTRGMDQDSFKNFDKLRSDYGCLINMWTRYFPKLYFDRARPIVIITFYYGFFKVCCDHTESFRFKQSSKSIAKHLMMINVRPMFLKLGWFGRILEFRGAKIQDLYRHV